MKKPFLILLIIIFATLTLSACNKAKEFEQADDLTIQTIHQRTNGDLIIDFKCNSNIRIMEISYDSGITWSNIYFLNNVIEIKFTALTEKLETLLNIVIRKGAYTEGKNTYKASKNSNTVSFSPLSPHEKHYKFYNPRVVDVPEEGDENIIPIGNNYAVYIKNQMLFIKSIQYQSGSTYILENIKNNEIAVLAESDFSNVTATKIVSAVSQNWVNVLANGTDVKNFSATTVDNKTVVYLFFKINTTYTNCNYITNTPLLVYVN